MPDIEWQQDRKLHLVATRIIRFREEKRYAPEMLWTRGQRTLPTGMYCTVAAAISLLNLRTLATGWDHVPHMRKHTRVTLLLQAIRRPDNGRHRNAVRAEHRRVALSLQWHDQLLLSCGGTFLDQNSHPELVAALM